MKPFDVCPICGGELVEKKVEKIVRGGVDTAILTVMADVCLRCGERLYSQDTVRQFELIRNKLERHETSGFHLMGHSFEIPEKVG
ncbi:MAG: hypothetical protein Kow0031_08740 [Anaerolineae bacterium]